MQKINVALLSFGMSGRVFHAPFIEAHRGFELIGAWERSEKRIQELYPNNKSYESLESLLQDPVVDLVVVNTPTYSHFELARKALEAGKHVVVEKAFTTTVEEAKALKSLAENSNLQLSVYQNRRWDSDFKTVQKVVAERWLGDLVEATFSFDRFNPNLSPKQHKETPGPGAGLVNDLGPHLIDQALTLFGMPEALFADIRITRPASKVDDYFEILLYYPRLRVRLKSGYFVRELAPAYILHGTKGSFVKTRADPQEKDLQAGKKPGDDWGTEPDSEYGWLHTEINGKVTREKIKSLQGNYMEYYNGVYESIRDNKEVPVSAEDGVRVMRIIEVAFASHEGKKIMELKLLSSD
jgi:predicted dehydrogenase